MNLSLLRADIADKFTLLRIPPLDRAATVGANAPRGSRLGVALAALFVAAGCGVPVEHPDASPDGGGRDVVSRDVSRDDVPALDDAPTTDDAPVLDDTPATDDAPTSADGSRADGTSVDAAHDGPAACVRARARCSGGGCCAGLECGTTTLGHVCCGEQGAPCASADGSDCCGELACVGGRCTGRLAGVRCEPDLTYFPVRGRHNLGYDPTAGDTSQWTCDDAHSNSDFVGAADRHLGNDIWAARGTPVVATVAGTLRYVEYTAYSGNKATIVDDCGWYHFYCHMDHFAMGIGPGSNGMRVRAGTVIGYVGNTGTASNGVVHLHYSIYPNDDYNSGIDPFIYLHASEADVCRLP